MFRTEPNSYRNIFCRPAAVHGDTVCCPTKKSEYCTFSSQVVRQSAYCLSESSPCRVRRQSRRMQDACCSLAAETSSAQVEIPDLRYDMPSIGLKNTSHYTINEKSKPKHLLCLRPMLLYDVCMSDICLPRTIRI